MSVLVALLFFIPAATGSLIVTSLNLLQEKITILLVGSIFGLATITTIAYVFFLFFIPSLFFIWILILIFCIPAFFLITKAKRIWSTTSFDRLALLILIIIFTLFLFIAPKLLITQSDGYYSGIRNAYSDIGWHIANITMFAQEQTAPPQNPIFAGTPLVYPFLINFFSALLLNAGATIPQSVNLPALILIPIFITLLYCLIRDLSKNKKIALLATVFFLFGGATLGWSHFLTDWQASGQSLIHFITHLPIRDFSGSGADEQGFHFLNPVASLVLPQRSLLFGFSLAFSILILLTSAQRNHRTFIFAGILSGLLPLFHAHTVLALIPLIIGLAIWDIVSRQPTLKTVLTHWLIFGLVAILVGLPEVAYYIINSHAESGAFFHFDPGWSMSSNDNFLRYWFFNTGLFIPITLWGLFLPAARQLKIFALAGLTLFIVANLWLFAPWAWDNYKLFVYFFIFILPLVSWIVIHYYTLASSEYLKALILFIVTLHVLAAGLDTFKLALPTNEKHIEWTNDGIIAAKAIKLNTKPNESIVTAPTHNSIVALAGRARYLGYTTQAWSHGLNPSYRADALESFFQGQSDRLPETKPDYVLIGPQEKHIYPNLIIRPS